MTIYWVTDMFEIKFLLFSLQYPFSVFHTLTRDRVKIRVYFGDATFVPATFVPADICALSTLVPTRHLCPPDTCTQRHLYTATLVTSDSCAYRHLCLPTLVPTDICAHRHLRLRHLCLRHLCLRHLCL